MKSFLDAIHDLVSAGDAFLEEHSEKEFAAFAETSLQSSFLAQTYKRSELSKLTLHSEFKTPQNYPHLEFSDLPLTLVRGKRCLVDVYIWYRRPTVIHNHHFSGAFMCLEGNNVDLEYNFIPRLSVGEYHEIGELTLKEKRNLKSGDVSRIDILDGYIHQNHHQADLTVNLTFRTNWLSGKTLSHYLIGGLRLEKNKALQERCQRLLGFLRLGDISTDEFSFSIDEALAFLCMTHHLGLGNIRVKKWIAHFEAQIKREAGIDLLEMLKEHEIYMNGLEEDYD